MTDPLHHDPVSHSTAHPPQARTFYLTKEWYKSMTIWGVIVSALMHAAIALGVDGYLVNETGRVAMQFLPSVIGLVADIIAAWGRGIAETKLST